MRTEDIDSPEYDAQAQKDPYDGWRDPIEQIQNAAHADCERQPPSGAGWLTLLRIQGKRELQVTAAPVQFDPTPG
jgi:hypothetical protein